MSKADKEQDKLISDVVEWTTAEKTALTKETRQHRVMYVLASAIFAMFSFFVVNGYETNSTLVSDANARAAQGAQTYKTTQELDYVGLYMITLEQQVCAHTPGCVVPKFHIPKPKGSK